MRRDVRYIKKFAISRPEWKGKIGSGFLITKLVTEKYQSNLYREDESLYYTMREIRNRLDYDLVVNHPVTPDCTITKGDNDSKTIFLRDKLSEAIDTLEVLFEADCTAEKAAKAWDKVFKTDYFINKYNERKNTEKAEQIRRIASSYSTPAKPWGN